MSNGLLPCPFCGGARVRNGFAADPIETGDWQALCLDCGARSGCALARDVTARLWNMRADAPPAPAPDAGGGAAFEEAVDALDKAAYFVAAWDFGQPAALGDPSHHRIAARARVLALHAAAVLAADAAGYARAMRECSIAEMVDAGFTEADAAADVDERMARAAAPTAPTLVHGGPPRDSLDDGR